MSLDQAEVPPQCPLQWAARRRRFKSCVDDSPQGELRGYDVMEAYFPSYGKCASSILAVRSLQEHP